MRRLFKTFAAAFLSFAVATALPAEQLCLGQEVTEGPDGRMLGHLPYVEAKPSELVAAPLGFAVNGACLIKRDMAYDLAQMLAAAQSTPGVGNSLHAVSCFRTVARQRAVFCSQIGPNKRCANAAERARAVGPPGYSEHATGYAIDFAARPSPGCSDVSACFAATAAGQWLIIHAPDYGFELSFPPGNAQGVTWEPWHWRWVGASAFRPGASAARGLFARARASFPAQPTTRDASPFVVPANLPLIAIPTPNPTPSLPSPPTPAPPALPKAKGVPLPSGAPLPPLHTGPPPPSSD